MRLITLGTYATDHLMRFSGRFADALLEGSLEKVSLSFLVEDLAVYRGGTGHNIAYAAGQLGARPALLAGVGVDFTDEDSERLRSLGIDGRFVARSETLHNARFTNVTDVVGAQIGAFYGGAMSESRLIDLDEVVAVLGGVDAVLISPSDPETMFVFSDACRANGWPLWADPGQQVTFFDGSQLRRLTDGARYLFTNDYEAQQLEGKTGWSTADILDRVGTWVVTKGPDGVEVRVAGREPVHVDAVRATAVETTGAGDALRGGFAAAHGWGLPDERAAQVGAAVASFAVEGAGPQEYTVTVDGMLGRIRSAYGASVADEIAAAASR